MAQVPQNEWAEALDLLRQASEYRRVSLSAFRHVGEGPVNTCSGFAWSADGSTHVQLVERLAVEYGDPTSVALLMEVSGADVVKFPDRAWDAKLATRVLTKVSAAAKAEATAQIAAWLAVEGKKS